MSNSNYCEIHGCIICGDFFHEYYPWIETCELYHCLKDKNICLKCNGCSIVVLLSRFIDKLSARKIVNYWFEFEYEKSSRKSSRKKFIFLIK